ncbi:MAG: GtrA family protein, partial [Clostridia bacterium]|nr:GtrA family protein [Clostridia bacterium]
VVVANTISFILSVTFAFFTNKFFVFKSKSESSRHMRREALKFFIARFLTFSLSLVSMVVLVDKFLMDHDKAKLLVSIVVIVLNYIFSKLIVFKNAGCAVDGGL